jgi:hypothetical protein
MVSQTSLYLGIRTSPSEVRYALIKKGADGNIELINRDSENKLRYPVAFKSMPERMKWLKSEIDRVFRQTPNIANAVIKTNEYMGSENASKRESAYAEAICILSAAECNVPISCKLYTQLGTKSKDVVRQAEERVGRTSKYWNAKMADAVMAALSAGD